MIDYENIFFESPLAQGLMDFDCDLVTFNRAFANCLGYSKTSLEEKNFQCLFEEREWLLLKSEIVKIIQEKENQTSEIILHVLTEDKENRTIHFKLSSNSTSRHIYMCLTHFIDSTTDIKTERLLQQNKYIKKALEKLTNTQEMMRAIAEAVPTALQVFDVYNQKYIFNNEKLASMLGYQADEFEQLFSDPIFENIHPTQREGIIEARYGILNKPRVSGEFMLKHKDNSYKWFSANVISLKNHQNKPYAIVTMLFDINDRINHENTLKNINQSLRENQHSLERTLSELSDRNFELDQLVYKISHDLRSPLSSILGLVSIYKIEEEAEKRDHYVSLIENRINKLDGFVKDMLNYAKANRSEVIAEEIDFELLINECLEDLAYIESASKIKVTFNINSSHSVFKSDLLRIRIILNNIISNAYKYYNPHSKKPYLKIDIQIEKEKVFIKIKDNGIGISEEYISKIFDMFFRATNRSDGAGLGMYIVKQSIDKLHGKIEIISTIDKGSLFKIELPNLATL
jgi:PAS domain S-box-containing protein